jgi:hypothetical protein
MSSRVAVPDSCVKSSWEIAGFFPSFGKKSVHMNPTKPFSLALSLLTVLLLTSLGCRSDGPEPAPQISAPLVALSYDGANQTAPLLPGGVTYEAAIRIPQADLGTTTAGVLETVYLYIQDVPESGTLLVYSKSTNETPDELLYSSVISADLKENSWNTHTLTREVVIPDQDIWIAFRFSHAFDQQTIGCDAGPGSPEGDWLYESSDNSWIPLKQRSPGVNINWNIRAAVRP